MYGVEGIQLSRQYKRYISGFEDWEWRNIARMVLTSKPYVADEREALRDLLQGLGTL